MAAELLEQVRAVAAGAKTEAAATYKTLLEHADRPGPADAARLAEAMEVLGRSASALEADLTALREAVRLEALIAKAPALEAAEQQAVDALAAFAREEAAHKEAARARRAELDAARRRIGGRLAQAREAVQELKRLKAKNYLAFGLEPAPPQPPTPPTKEVVYSKAPVPRMVKTRDLGR
jgi:hypothetical protein